MEIINSTIIYIIPHLEPFSEEKIYSRHFRERKIVHYTCSLGHECMLFFLTYGKKIKKDYYDPRVCFFPVDNPDTGTSNTCISKLLRDEIDELKPDLVIFKGLGYKLSYWLITKTKHDFHYAFIVGGGTSDILVSKASYILGETKLQLKKYFKKHTNKNRAMVLPKLLSTEDFIKNNIKHFDIINVGEFKERKNQESLIPLFTNYRVALIGSGENFDKIKSYANEYPNVYMPGSVSREKISKYISRSRIMVHPSKAEGLPRVIMESFACGVPVIVLRKAIPDGFVDGVHGLMVSEDELVDTVEELLNDEERIEKMGRNAFEFAYNNCREENVFEVIDYMYSTILKDSKPGKAFKYRMKVEVLVKLYWQKIIVKLKAIRKIFKSGSLSKKTT